MIDGFIAVPEPGAGKRTSSVRTVVIRAVTPALPNEDAALLPPHPDIRCIARLYTAIRGAAARPPDEPAGRRSDVYAVCRIRRRCRNRPWLFHRPTFPNSSVRAGPLRISLASRYAWLRLHPSGHAALGRVHRRLPACARPRRSCTCSRGYGVSGVRGIEPVNRELVTLTENRAAITWYTGEAGTIDGLCRADSGALSIWSPVRLLPSRAVRGLVAVRIRQRRHRSQHRREGGSVRAPPHEAPQHVIAPLVTAGPGVRS